jgi:outer membrane immunogenic protein
MKTLLLAGASLFALGAASASAADLPARMPAKAPAYVAPMAYNWTGFYLGLNGGYGFGRGEFNGALPSGRFDAGGGLFGATVGYNWQTGPVVFGLEGDIDWSGMKGTGTCGGITSCEVRNDYLSTIRGRLGYAFDRWMPYITGGAAIGNVKTSIAGFGDTNNTKGGWTIGGGVEASIAGPWTAKVEYLHVDLGDADTAIAGESAKFTSDIIRGGINYKF